MKYASPIQNYLTASKKVDLYNRKHPHQSTPLLGTSLVRVKEEKRRSC